MDNDLQGRGAPGLLAARGNLGIGRAKEKHSWALCSVLLQLP